MADLAKLVVKLEAETARYQRELEKANRKLAGFKRSSDQALREAGKAFVQFGALAAAGLTAMAKSAVDNADNLYKMSQALGISTASLSQLEYAAKLSGVELESVQKGLGRLARNAADAAEGLATPRQAFEALGVTAQNADGTLKGTEELLFEVADAFAGFEDGAGKAALAQELFGRAGLQLIPFLNQGSAGIRAMKEEAAAFGLTVTDEAGAAAEQFNDNLSRLSEGLKGAMNQALQRVLPMLLGFSESALDAAKSGEAMDKAARVLETGLRLLISTGVVVWQVFERVGEFVGAAAAAVLAVADGEFARAWEIMKANHADAEASAAATSARLAAIWAEGGAQVVASAEKTGGAVKKALNFAPASKQGSDPAARALEQLQGLVDGVRQQVETFGAGQAAIMAYRVSLGDLAAQFAAAGPAAEPLRQQLLALSVQLEELTLQQEAAVEAEQRAAELRARGAAVTESVLEPVERYRQEAAELAELLAAGAISQETFNRAVEQSRVAYEKAGEGINKFAEQATRNVQDILADFFEDPFSKGLDGLVEDFGRMLQRMAAQAIAADIAGKIFGTGGVGSGGGGLFDTVLGKAGDWLGGLFGGFRAAGGPVAAGSAYVVGERGPELFVPDMAGRIEPSAGGGMTVQQNFTISAPGGQVSRQTQQQVAAAAARGLAEANRRSN